MAFIGFHKIIMFSQVVLSCPLVFISFHQCFNVFLVCSQEKSKLSQLVMFEATKRSVRSLEESVWRTERYQLIDAVRTALETSEVDVVVPGTMRVELLTRPGYLGCEAFNWLAQHGGIEGGYEMNTILVLQEGRIMKASRYLQLQWLYAQHGEVRWQK